MASSAEQLSSGSLPARDAEALTHLEQAITGGKHWYLALLEAMGLWGSAEEDHNERVYRYLIAGEAFDWLLLAERLCQAVDDLLPVEEKEALLFNGQPPLELSPEQATELIGTSKYHQYLNYFYGVIVEKALLMAVQEEVTKERHVLASSQEPEALDEAYRRIYGATRAGLLKRFRRESSHPQLRSITLTELKEFTYWLFKLRLKQCDKARVASDTKKALQQLRSQWVQRGFFGLLAVERLSGED
jgi:hypothetical protein